MSIHPLTLRGPARYVPHRLQALAIILSLLLGLMMVGSGRDAQLALSEGPEYLAVQGRTVHRPHPGPATEEPGLGGSTCAAEPPQAKTNTAMQ